MNPSIETSVPQVSGGYTHWEEQLRFLDIKLINVSDFTELVLRFLLNTIIVVLIVHFLYARRSKQKDYYFSYIAIGGIVFLLCFLLNNVKLELGFALGLFAIFAIIRYRTNTIPIKEMTYLFIVIGISVMNAIASKKVSYAELFFVNLITVFGLAFLESRLLINREYSLLILYEKIEYMNLQNEGKLLEDLKQRTGINVKRYEVRKLDFLRDVAEITVYYNLEEQNEIQER
jgi:hypothetical protein